MQAGSEKTKQNALLSKWLNREKQSEETKGVQPRPKGMKVPLSSGQQRLLFLQQLYPENPFYHYADAYKFKGKLDIDSLIKSFETIALRHSILRTKVIVENGQAFQKTNDSPLFEITEHDLRDVADADIEKVFKDLAIKEANKLLDSPDGYLTRISFLHLKDDECVMILTVHHIITDKWSMRILRDELAENYQKLCNGKQLDSSPLEIQYADYAYWQSLQKPNPTNLSYWKNKLENSLTSLNLPTDFPRPVRPTFHGAYSTQKLSADLSTKLKNLCRNTNKTLYVVLLTAYKILLKQYSNETDILVGSPFTNRDEIALEKLIGFFNDTLVLRSDLSKNPTFAELLEQVWTTTQDAFTHKNMPFETLVKSLKIDRQLNYNPLFQVMFIYHNVPTMPDFGKDLEIEQEPFDFGVTKFDLTLFIAEDGEDITSIFEYAKDLFDESTIKRMHGHLENLLEGIVKNPNQRISELPLITDDELNQFSKWNSSPKIHIDAKFTHELFEKHALQQPDSPALSFQNETLTYRELNERSNSVASYLLDLEINHNNPIGLFVESSPDMIIGILGILKAGLAYLPLDAEYPKERIDFILKDSGTSTVLTQKHLLETVSTNSAHVQTIDKIVESTNSEKPILREEIDEEDLAYVIYTSGSSGQPKGVSVTHKNLLHSTAARFEFYPNPPKSFLLLSSFSFDSSVVGIFWTLATGGKLVLAERRIEQDLESLAKLFLSEKITHTLLLPTLYSLIIKHIQTKYFNSLDTVIVAGEACPTSLCKEHFEILPNVNLYNEYGPTEATVWATAHKIRPEDTQGTVPIGRPIAGTQIHILDENQTPVPINVIGEMYIGGNGVTKGYLNNSNILEKHFLPDPFAEEVSSKMYRTGDLCRYRSDGTIEFLGRKDKQIKIRGYRIELNEIQETIKQHPDIHDVVVKLEDVPKSTSKKHTKETDDLFGGLQQISFENADEILNSVERFSDKEIDFMLNEMESA